MRRPDRKSIAAIWVSACALTAAAQLQRLPNAALANLPSVPPASGFVLSNAFPTVPLDQPVAIVSPPQETNRLFFLEKTGNIIVITNLAAPTRTVFMNLPVAAYGDAGLLGLAFHPGYATNRYLFVFSSRTLNTSQGNGLHECISRFQTTATNPNVALPETELPLITQYDDAQDHNGGDLHFGPDGYLYASVGDEGGQYNVNQNAQVITNQFNSAILRLDVDKQPGNLSPNPYPASSTNYFVPVDNPYVGLTNFQGRTFSATNVRTEFFAIGFRNPWRFSIDPVTGFIYVGDVGQDLYEEVDVITNGANCGWAYYEGFHLAAWLYPNHPTILTNPPSAGLNFPIQEIPHYGTTNYSGNCVIGGVVYRGSRFPQLNGAYIFTDWGSGCVWMLHYDGTHTTAFEFLTASIAGPVAVGTDPRNGDVLIAQINNGQIARLDYSSNSIGPPLPPTLADTTAFTNLPAFAPAAGVVPYDVNVPQWADNAVQSQWFSLPNTNWAITFDPTGNWNFPAGSVWIKHFDMELTNGVTGSRRPLETQFLERNTNGVYGFTYRWDSATNATLVPDAGTNDTLVINDGGTLRTQVWHYCSRSECLACHTAAGGYAIGFNTPQLNRDFKYDPVTTNQIAALNAAGFLYPPVTNDVRQLLALAASTNNAYSVEFRARSFLAANCAPCHQPGGPAQPADWDARIVTPTASARLVNATPKNGLGQPDALLVAPQSPGNSVLLTRLAVRDLGSHPSVQMPPLASNWTNAAAIQLITDWINSLPAGGSPAQPRFNYFSHAGTNTVLRGSNGWPTQVYFVRASTNLTVPLPGWPVVSTGSFDPLGNFNFTNPVVFGATNAFYLLQLP